MHYDVKVENLILVLELYKTYICVCALQKTQATQGSVVAAWRTAGSESVPRLQCYDERPPRER